MDTQRTLVAGDQPLESAQARPPVALGVLLLALLAGSQYLVVLPVVGPSLQTLYGLSNRQLGTLFSFPAVGSMVALVVLLPTIAKIGVSRFVQIGFATMGACFILCGLVRGLVLLEIGLLLCGLFMGALAIAGMAYLVELFAAWKRRILALSLTAAAFPTIVFPPLIQRAIPAGDAPPELLSRVVHAPFLAVGGLMVLGALVLRLRAPACNARPGEVPPVNWRAMLSGPTLTIIFLAALHGTCDDGTCTWIPKFMQGSFEQMPIAPGMVLGLYGLAYLIGRVLLAMAPEGFGQRALITLPGPVGGLILLWAVWQGDALQVGILVPVAAFIYGMEYPVLISEIESGSSSQFSGVLVVAGLATQAMRVAFLNGVGWIADATGSLPLSMTPMAVGFVLFGAIAYSRRIAAAARTSD